MPRKKKEPEKHSGVIPLDRPGHFEIRVRVRSRETGNWINTKRRLRGVTLEQAIEEREKLLVEAQDGALDGEAPCRMTLGDYSKRWIERRKAKGEKYSTRLGKVTTLNRRILPKFGTWYVDAIRRTNVEQWLVDSTKVISERDGKPISPVTVNTWLRILKACVAAYYKEYELGESPLAGIEPLREPKRRSDNPNSLPAAMLPMFMAKVAELYPQHYALIYLAITSGMRWSEISALTWDDIDEPAGVIHIRRGQVDKHVDTTKTGEPRDIGLAPEVAEVLRQHRQQLVADQAPGLETGIIFPSQAGTYSFPSRIQKPLERICKALGLPYKLSPHGLRRTFNNMLRQQGVDRQVLRALTGHSSEEMTGRYSTVQVDELQAAVGRVVRLTRPAEQKGA